MRQSMREGQEQLHYNLYAWDDVVNMTKCPTHLETGAKLPRQLTTQECQGVVHNDAAKTFLLSVVPSTAHPDHATFGNIDDPNPLYISHGSRQAL